MIDFLRWLIVLEVLAAAAFPLSARVFRVLPDRGAAFSITTGLLVVTYVSWVVGLVIPVASGAVLPGVVTILVGAGCWLAWGRETVRELTAGACRAVVIEQVIVIGGLALWSLLRANVFYPPIVHTEQFMDMAFLNASIHSASYPPYDPWMSAHTINYYYFGYLAFAQIVKLSGVPAAVGYNLALSTLFAAVLTSAYGLGLMLTRRFTWAALAPVVVGVAGNWHGPIQVLQGHLPGNTNWWFWDSSRVVAGHGDYTINEFPMFSFILGDLHPHVMALPFALLAVGLAAAWLFTPGEGSTSTRTALTAVGLGSLFVTNSWDLPTYFLVVAGAIFLRAYISDGSRRWWRRPVMRVAIIGFLSVLLYAPFYVTFHSPVHGLGMVTTRTALWQFIEVFGLQLVLCGLIVGTLGFLLQPAEDYQTEMAAEAGSAEAGYAWRLGQNGLWAAVTLVLAAVLGLLFSAWTLLLIVALGLAALFVLERVLNTEEPNRSDALAMALVVVACLVLAATEIIYIRDSFDGSDSYRMNTVFKFYYQAWVLLGLAGSYGLYRALGILRNLFSGRSAALAGTVAALALCASGVFPVLASTTPVQAIGNRSLNGLDWMRVEMPGDYRGIEWLIRHAPERAVEAEATGDGYTSAARVSTFTGLPTIMGWADHEEQWRGSDPQIEMRIQDVQTLYSTHSIAQARAVLRRYHVRYVFVGSLEQQKYGSGNDLTKFAHFLPVAYRAQGVTIYTTQTGHRVY